MQVLVADALGLCFGVRDALRVASRAELPEQTTILGQLVHNEQVRGDLAARGFIEQAEDGRDALPDTPRVMITAHGISHRRRAELLAAGKTLIDTTCPLVTRVHDAARRFEREGCRVLVVGRSGHVEVSGIVEDLVCYTVIESADDVQTWPELQLGMVCQSTSNSEQVDALRRLVVQRNPHATVRFVDTVCQPTKDRQQAVLKLLPLVDAMVVVGGHNSNNTRQLARRASEVGVPAFHVQSAADLRAAWFAGMRCVGLTAGTSTLDETVEQVRRALAALEVEPVAASG